MKKAAKILFLDTALLILAGSTIAQSAPDQPSNIYPADGSTTHTNTVSMKVTDRQGDAMTVKLYGRIKPGVSKFTIIGLPDTQLYTEEPQGLHSDGGGNNAIFKSQTNWIAQHRKDSNIVFVAHLGDCTQNGDDKEIEWRRADTAFRNIEGIAYGICVGNHDESPAGDQEGTTAFFNNYFGSARFTGRDYYGGHYGANNDNHFELFNGGGIDFIHISLEYNTNSTVAEQTALQNVLNWADSLLKAYSNRKAILSSHWLMGPGIQTSFEGPGQKIYDELKDNPNLVLMLSGHVSGEGRRSDTFNSAVVHTLLSDYQGGYGNGGDGLLRIMQFDPHENSVSVKTFSPWKNNQAGGFLTGQGSQFTLPVSLTPSFTLIGTNTNINSGNTTVFTWDGIQKGTTYEWYVVISDGKNNSTSGTFEFISN